MQDYRMQGLRPYFCRSRLLNLGQRWWVLRFGLVASLTGLLLSIAGMPDVRDCGFQVSHANAAPPNCTTPGSCEVLIDAQAQQRPQARPCLVAAPRSGSTFSATAIPMRSIRTP